MRKVWRAIVEVGFIVFLFYSNLLMGEFERSGIGQGKGFVWAVGDVVTGANFMIALIAALIGHVLFEFFRSLKCRIAPPDGLPHVLSLFSQILERNPTFLTFHGLTFIEECW